MPSRAAQASVFPQKTQQVLLNVQLFHLPKQGLAGNPGGFGPVEFFLGYLKETVLLPVFRCLAFRGKVVTAGRLGDKPFKNPVNQASLFPAG